MSYWVPSAILVLVLLVLIAQLPWRSPTRRSDYLRKQLELGGHDISHPDLTDKKESRGQDPVVFKS